MTRPIHHEVVHIDPMFFIPEGVKELVYEDEGIEDIVVEDEVEITGYYEDDSDGDDTSDSDTPDTPQVLFIVPPQVIRMTNAGNEVVDVVFEVEDVAGATKYEFRVTKI